MAQSAVRHRGLRHEEVLRVHTSVANYVFSRKPPKKPAAGVQFVTEPVKRFAKRLRATPGKHNSLLIDAVGNYPSPIHRQMRAWDAQGNLTFDYENGGDYLEPYRCRMTPRATLVCLERAIPWANEFKRMEVRPHERCSAHAREPSLGGITVQL